MCVAILGIFSVHVQQPRTTKFHSNRTNPVELRRHVDFPWWRPRLGNFTPNFGETSQSTNEILLLPVSEIKRPPCWNSTSSFDFHVLRNHRHVILPIISSKSDYPRRSYGVISSFQDGWRHWIFSGNCRPSTKCEWRYLGDTVSLVLKFRLDWISSLGYIAILMLWVLAWNCLFTWLYPPRMRRIKGQWHFENEQPFSYHS